MMRFTLSAVLAAALLLAACSKSTPTDSASGSSQPSLSGAVSPEAVRQAAESAKAADLPHPDWNTPDSAYVPLTKSSQIMYLDAALSGMPPDYDKMAQTISSAYRGTSDAFKKHDLLEVIQPKLDAGIADAKSHPYIVWTDDSPQIGHYDFNQHTFPDNSALFQEGGYVTFYDSGTYNVALTNGRAFQQLPVKDEVKARSIEALVSKWGALRVKVFAFAQSTDDSGSAPTVQALVTKLQLLGPQGQVLLEQVAPH